jgi:OOP family OmpA-OmpF porin
MRPGTNRLLMLLIGAAISGCASQTDRSSSGGGAEPPAQVAAPQPAPAPAPAPAYEPEKESVQFVDRPLEETPPPKPVVTAPKDEALPDFPITKYELPEEEAAEDLGPVEDESESAEQEATAASESSVSEPTEYPDEPEETESAEVEDLGPVADESGTMSYPEDNLAATDNVVGAPQIYPDEPAAKAAPTAPAAPKIVTVNFEAGPLFNFDKSAVRADQQAKLDEFVAGLAGTEYDSIVVVGHADKIGKVDYNQKLSERRAEAVRIYLANHGVPANRIQASGRGEQDPVSGDACKSARGKALIACLQPDRRVEVSVSATKKQN